MAVVFNMKHSNSNDGFFQKIVSTPAFAIYNSLIANGVKFNLSFYSVTADMSAHGKAAQSVTLPVSTTSILKGTVGAELMPIVRETLEGLLKSVSGEMAVVMMKAATESPKFADIAVEPPSPQEFKMPAAKKVAKKPVVAGVDMGVVPLSEASALLQPVKGTSVASVYQAVALSERVKVGVRLKKSGTLSVRVEGTPTVFEQQKLANIGLAKGGAGYWSIHFDIGEVPVSRCLGAFLLGLEIPFDEIVMDTTGVKAV